jgi:hypothetical protein
MILTTHDSGRHVIQLSFSKNQFTLKIDEVIQMEVALVVIIGLLIYFLPTIVASNKHKRNAASIFVVNLFLGWMLIGWVIALAWAVAKD